MSLPATEIAVMTFKAGATVEDPSSSAAQAFQHMLKTISQQEGFQRVFWGRRVENESEVQLLVGKCCPLPNVPTPTQYDMLTKDPHRLGLGRIAQEIHRQRRLRAVRRAHRHHHRWRRRHHPCVLRASFARDGRQ